MSSDATAMEEAYERWHSAELASQPEKRREWLMRLLERSSVLIDEEMDETLRRVVRENPAVARLDEECARCTDAAVRAFFEAMSSSCPAEIRARARVLAATVETAVRLRVSYLTSLRILARARAEAEAAAALEDEDLV